jgi:hypothetical protein
MTGITFRKPGQLDEQDKLIMVRAQRIQLLAIMFALVAWVISLSEIYHTEGQIPSIGVLIGYWRGVGHD